MSIKKSFFGRFSRNCGRISAEYAFFCVEKRRFLWIFEDVYTLGARFKSVVGILCGLFWVIHAKNTRHPCEKHDFSRLGQKTVFVQVRILPVGSRRARSVSLAGQFRSGR